MVPPYCVSLRACCAAKYVRVLEAGPIANDADEPRTATAVAFATWSSEDASPSRLEWVMLVRMALVGMG